MPSYDTFDLDDTYGDLDDVFGELTSEQAPANGGVDPWDLFEEGAEWLGEQAGSAWDWLTGDGEEEADPSFWKDPFGATTGFLEDATESVADWFGDFFGEEQEPETPDSDGYDFLDALGGAAGSLFPGLTDLLPGAPAAAGQEAGGWRRDPAEDFWSSLGEGVSEFTDWVSDLWSGGVESAGQALDWLGEALSTYAEEQSRLLQEELWGWQEQKGPLWHVEKGPPLTGFGGARPERA